jgi:hypothetical protein
MKILLTLLVLTALIISPQLRAEDSDGDGESHETSSSTSKQTASKEEENSKGEAANNPAVAAVPRESVTAFSGCISGDCYRTNPLGTYADDCFQQNTSGCIRPAGVSKSQGTGRNATTAQ